MFKKLFIFLIAFVSLLSPQIAEAYTLSFDSQGGFPFPNVDKMEGETVTLFESTRDEYVFLNWNTQSDGEGIAYLAGTLFTMPAYDLTLYAIWGEESDETYTLSFDTQGGDPLLPDITDLSPGDEVELTEDITKPGYYFDHWNTEPDGSGDDYYGGNMFEMPAYDVILYAIWLPDEVDTYTLSFNTQGGSAVADITGIEAGNPVAIPVAPTRTGYSFLNWNTVANGSGTQFQPGDNFTMPANDTTLYAIWEVSVYALSYSAGTGGTISGSVFQPVTHGGNGTQVTAVPNTGYAFAEWSDGVTTASRTDTNVTGDIIVEAEFELVDYELSFDTDGGVPSIISSETLNYDDTFVLPVAPTKAGYIFIEWNTASDASGVGYAANATFTMPANDTTLYAIWAEEDNVDENNDGDSESRSERSGSTSRSGGTSVAARVNNLFKIGNIQEAIELIIKYPNLFFASQTNSVNTNTQSNSSLIIRDLELGMTGEDVVWLQRILNSNGFMIASSGAGSPGNETEFFGALTQAALARYQAANGISPASGYFGPLTRTFMKNANLNGVWW